MADYFINGLGMTNSWERYGLIGETLEEHQRWSSGYNYPHSQPWVSTTSVYPPIHRRARKQREEGREWEMRRRFLGDGGEMVMGRWGRRHQKRECYGMKSEETWEEGWSRAGGERQSAHTTRKSAFLHRWYRMARLQASDPAVQYSASQFPPHANSHGPRLGPTSALDLISRPPLHEVFPRRPRAATYGTIGHSTPSKTYSDKSTETTFPEIDPSLQSGVRVVDIKEVRSTDRGDEMIKKPSGRQVEILMSMNQDPREFYRNIFPEQENVGRGKSESSSSSSCCPECGQSWNRDEFFYNLKKKTVKDERKKIKTKSLKKDTIQSRKSETNGFFLPELFHRVNSSSAAKSHRTLSPPENLGHDTKKVSVHTADCQTFSSPIAKTTNIETNTKSEPFLEDSRSSAVEVSISDSNPSDNSTLQSNPCNGSTQQGLRATCPLNSSISIRDSTFESQPDDKTHSSSNKSFGDPSTSCFLLEPSPNHEDRPAVLSAKPVEINTSRTELESEQEKNDELLTQNSPNKPATFKPPSDNSGGSSVNNLAKLSGSFSQAQITSFEPPAIISDVSSGSQTTNSEQLSTVNEIPENPLTISKLPSISGDFSASDLRKTYSGCFLVDFIMLKKESGKGTVREDGDLMNVGIPLDPEDTKVLFEVNYESSVESIQRSVQTKEIPRKCFCSLEVGGERLEDSSDDDIHSDNYCSFNNPSFINVSRLSLPPVASPIYMQNISQQNSKSLEEETGTINKISLLSAMNEVTNHNLEFFGRHWKSSFKTYFDYFINCLKQKDNETGGQEEKLRENLVCIMNRHKEVTLSIIESVIEQTTSYVQRSMLDDSFTDR